MDIFAFAIQMEKDGEAFYRKLAGDAPNAGLAAILNRLADTELTHQTVLEQVRDRMAPEGSDTEVIADVKNIFQELAEKGVNTLVDSAATDEYVALYRKAQEIEKKNADFYCEHADGADGRAKEIFQVLADEEMRHYYLLENLIQYVSRTDFQWIEFAEWHHDEDY